MATVIVVGTQWGDEGKGKIVDLLTEFSDVVVRHQGGNNAGHTVVVGKEKVILHLVPSGILHKTKKCCVSNGVVIDPAVILGEIDEIKSKGYLDSPERLRISGQCHVIMPYHKALDIARESYLADRKIGTTGRGIGPVYEDKYARRGVRLADLLKPELLRAKVAENLKLVNVQLEHLYGVKPMADDFTETYLEMGKRLEPYIADVTHIVHDSLSTGRHMLFECAQGVMLDPDHGTFPFTTSSPTTAGGALTGAGVGPSAIDCVVGITKAYTTRVGSGPFPTELNDELGQKMRDKGHEYGSTTGRPRRTGWLDAVVLRYAAKVNGLDYLAITKLDVMAGLEKIKIAVGYKYKGKLFDTFPLDPEAQANVEPVYEEMAGFGEELGDVREWDDLPANAKRYLNRISDLCGVPIAILSVGPARNETLVLHNPFREPGADKSR